MVSVDGEIVLEAQEKEYTQGKVGFWAQIPVQLAVLRLSTSRELQARPCLRARLNRCTVSAHEKGRPKERAMGAA
jgi:hypothetical protein